MKIPQNIAELQGISHTYGEKPVLANLTVSFKKSAVTALMGKSGSGKSTLLQLINGMIRPTTGIVKIFGENFDYENATQNRLKIGYAVQQVGLFPHLTIEENIGILGKITNRPKEIIKLRIEALMDTVQLSLSYLKKYPYELSGGEQQRVGLCRALFLKPPLLLMDEPFASLDYATRKTIYAYFKKLQEMEPCSVIIVTHQFEEAELLADEFVWLENGKIKTMWDKTKMSEIKLNYLSAP